MTTVSPDKDEPNVRNKQQFSDTVERGDGVSQLALLKDAYDQLAAGVDSVLAHEARIVPPDLKGRLQGLQVARTKTRSLRAKALVANPTAKRAADTIEELTNAASKFASLAHRAGPTTDLYWAACERLEAVLTKIGGDA